MQKLRFLLVIPVAALAWAGAAAVGPTPSVAAQGTVTAAPTPSAPAQSRIGTISWRGNSLFSTAQLQAMPGLKPDDAYDAKELEKRLGSWNNKNDITSSYMDRG